MKYWIITGLGLAMTACATGGKDADVKSDKRVNTQHAQPILGHPDATPFDAEANGKVDFSQALARAKTEDKFGLIVLGANWCSDCRALAGHFQTQRFQSLFDENYALAYIDVANKDKNLDVAKRLGLETIEGIPTVFVTDSSGKVLNLENAPTWRDAGNRNGDDIYTFFEAYTR